MKKAIIAIITLIILLTAGEITSAPLHTASAATYKNPVKYKGVNYYSWGTCAYYAFNRRAQLGRPVSNKWGNARYWASNARQTGYTVRKKPVFGAVLVSQAGYYGHVAVVERVNSNGSILLSEMNFPRLGVKTYRTLSRSTASQYYFIY